LDFGISRLRHASERGVFEPDFVASFAHDVNKRENTAEQSSAQFGRSTFTETNDIYNGGLESLVPSGARVRLGYTLRDLRNSLQSGIRSTNGEYQTFFGATVTQPLLKNFGFTATMAGIRVAALNSEVAFQEYRRQLMLVVSTAEAAYWNLFMAQEQVHWLDESVALAETIVRDNRARNEAGRGSELEVLEAQAGLALRRAKLEEARQHHQEAVSQVVSMFQSSTVLFNGQLAAAEAPESISFSASLMESWRTARDQNPDYLAQLKRYGIENVRRDYARNQRLPQLDLKGSYGRR